MARSVKIEQRGRVLLARLHNPPHNFMTASMVVELERLVERADADPGVGAVILTGEHPSAFITHYDVAEILSRSTRFERPLPPVLAGWGLRAVAGIERVPGVRAALRHTPASGRTRDAKGPPCLSSYEQSPGGVRRRNQRHCHWRRV